MTLTDLKRTPVVPATAWKPGLRGLPQIVVVTLADPPPDPAVTP